MSETEADPLSGDDQQEDAGDSQKCILIVDDSSMMRLAVREILAPLGHEILEAGDGEEALDIAFFRELDMMFLDWIMPKKSGLEVLRELREVPRTKDLPVVLLTQLTDPTVVREAAPYGVVDYLSKPANPRRLVEKVRKYLD